MKEPDTQHEDSDTTSVLKSLSDWFSKGHYSVLWRTQAMATIHEGDLSDHWASGTAFRLHYETAHWRGWSLVVGGQFGYALASSDLTDADDLTGRRARFELHMFDIEDPQNRKDFDRLENLFLKKEWAWGDVEVGRFSFDSPFVNGQDSRLKANAFSGAEFGLYPDQHRIHRFRGAFIYGISPRGTVEWFSLQQSVGLLDNGFLPNGEEAEYEDNVHSHGLYILGYEFEKKKVGAQAWYYYADNLFQQGYARADVHPDAKHHWNFGAEILWQQRVGQGGNAHEELRYYHNDAPAVLVGGRVRYEQGRHGIEAAGLASVGDGTYLFPREWGKEQFFTSVPRARVEGLGKFTELAVHYDCKVSESLTAAITFARLDALTTTDFLFNKFSLIDHYLVNAEAEWKGSKFWENFTVRFITAAHYPEGRQIAPEDEYYKAEFLHFTLQADLAF